MIRNFIQYGRLSLLHLFLSLGGLGLKDPWSTSYHCPTVYNLSLSTVLCYQVCHRCGSDADLYHMLSALWPGRLCALWALCLCFDIRLLGWHLFLLLWCHGVLWSKSCVNVKWNNTLNIYGATNVIHTVHIAYRHIITIKESWKQVMLMMYAKIESPYKVFSKNCTHMCVCCHFHLSPASHDALLSLCKWSVCNCAEYTRLYMIIFLVAAVGGCDVTMEAQNNNQPSLDNHNNLYKIPGQEDQVGCLTSDSERTATCCRL